MGDERAETYLRLRAEAELRQAADRLRGLDAAVRPDDRADPGMPSFATAEGAYWKVIRAGRILVAAGVLEEDLLTRFPADLLEAIKVRSRILLNRDRRRGVLYALAGLSTAGGESYLHVVGKGMAPLADRFAWNWTPGFSWWLRDGTENWHVAAAGEPHMVGEDVQAFRLRLTPPLAAVPDTAEVVVTGPATRIRATVPIRPARETTASPT